MSAFTDARGQLDALEADIVSIRRQIEDGGAVDLINQNFIRVLDICSVLATIRPCNMKLHPRKSSTSGTKV